MRGLNKVYVFGNVCNTPELRHTRSRGTSVTNFQVATNHGWTDGASGDWREETEFHSIVCWGKTAEFAAERIRMGDPLMVEGRLKTTKRVKTVVVGDIETEVTEKTTQIVALQLFVGGKRRDDAAEPKEEGNKEVAGDDEDEAPDAEVDFSGIAAQAGL
jgi:single-strand DNA-binding protein